MAKIKPVIKSVMILTEIALALPYAKFFYSSWTTHAPLPGMNVNVSGFQNDVNNVISQIETTSGGASGWFTVTNFGCIPEIHAAIAHAQSALPQLCTNAPNPYTSQAMQKTTNRNGCIYKPKSPMKKGHPQSRTGSFGGKVLPDIFTFNKGIFRKTQKLWAGAGPYAGKPAWEALAAACPVMNYKGITKTLTGKQYWTLACKYNNQAWSPYSYPHGAEIFYPPNLTAASDWVPSAPNITGTVLEPSGRLYLQTPWDDHFNACIMQPEISVPPTAPIPTLARSHVMSSETGLIYLSEYDDPFHGFYGPCAVWKMDINYPFFKDGLHGIITFAVRIFDFNRWTFSDYTWLRATPN